MEGKSGDLRRRVLKRSRKGNKNANEQAKRHSPTSNMSYFLFWLKKHSHYYKPDNLVKFLYQPTCSKSLGVVRALFGLMMVIDVPDERGLADIDVKYGNPMQCHFPLLNWMSPLSLEYMGVLYLLMWIGAAGMCLGYKFRLSVLFFVLPYWYIFFLDKTVWNNHSYLYGLISFLFLFTSANHSYSVDSLLHPSIKDVPIPLWNYAMIRFQFFLLYFYAGVKKFDLDWIGGYSMTHLSSHWVFHPFRIVLTNEQIDFWIIHIFGFLFDLSVGFFLLIEKTRPVAMIFSAAFHFMNSRMFYIGQFPYVCLVTTPIFCSYDWPEQIFKERSSFKREDKLRKSSKVISDGIRVTWKHRMVAILLTTYVGGQLFLPFSHFITQGYNNWTNGLYGYSWDMMVHSWDTILIVVKVVDNTSGEEFFLDPGAWVLNTRYSSHGDMLIQYAKCLERNLKVPSSRNTKETSLQPTFNDTSIYIDVWCSLNGRFQQRMFDPRQDLLKVKWSPFEKLTWLMPLLTEFTAWRRKMTEIQNDVQSWSNYSDVLFVADFPGLFLENYISPQLTNVTLTVLQGIVILEQSYTGEPSALSNMTLHPGESSRIPIGKFHKIYTISFGPSCYMYTYYNRTLELSERKSGTLEEMSSIKGNKSLIESLSFRLEGLIDSLLILRACLNKLLYNEPIPIRSG